MSKQPSLASWVDVTADDIEDLRDVLDAAILAWRSDGRGPGRISGRSQGVT